MAGPYLGGAGRPPSLGKIKTAIETIFNSKRKDLTCLAFSGGK